MPPPFSFFLQRMARTLRQIAIDAIYEALEKDAERILKECISEIDYQHRTLNLYDSYGYGIYVEGKLVTMGFLHPTASAKTVKTWYGEKIKGRQAIEEYLRGEYKPAGVVDLAIAASMPYAHVLEEGSAGLHRKYKVISMSFQKLKDISKEYKGIVNAIKQLKS